MIIRSGKKRPLGIDEPLRHESHKRPVTRRDFLAQGFTTGVGTVVAPTLLGALAYPNWAQAALSEVVDDLRSGYCGITGGSGMVPFIAFDLAGGANIAGSNCLVGQAGDQMSFLSTAGYSKLGIPGDQTPNAGIAGTNFIDTSLGIAFHSDSAFLRGMMRRMSATTALGVNGVIIAARSENDTGNNPHNPMYGIAKIGAKGELLTLIGSQNSDSGGNSMAPLMMIDPTMRPTKVDRVSDARGLVDVGDLTTLFPGPTGQADTRAVMEAIAMASRSKLNTAGVSTLLTDDAAAKQLVACSYVKTAYQADRYASGPAVVDPTVDPAIIGTGFPTPIFAGPDFNNGEFAKTASIMKLVIGGFAGAGTVTMGGFDYHTGDRMTGEVRDERAGECMGACLEYAARLGVPLMLYIFSDGSLSSNGMIDNSTNGRGKGVWTGDNQATAASLILVYKPGGVRPVMARNQIGSYSAGGDVLNASSPAANAVNLLVETVLLNYMAANNRTADFQTVFPTSGLSAAQIAQVLAVPTLI